MMLDMDHGLMVLLVLVWSSGLHAKEIHNVPVRLVGGSSRCAGTLEVQYHGHWSGVDGFYWIAKEAAEVCRKLECGSLVSVDRKKSTDNKATLKISSLCVYPERTVHDCIRRSSSSSVSLEITCSDSVRLLGGTSLCSGRLEVKSDQSAQRWSSVCEADFDQQDAEVVCRELGCGPPSVLQGALYGEVEAPTLTKEFQCGGNESALLDCRSSGSTRNSCSPGKAVGLTCSEQIRLAGGASRCAGTLELKQREWRPVSVMHWSLNHAAAVCRYLDCGSAVSTGSVDSAPIPVWRMGAPCLNSSIVRKDCVRPDTEYDFVVIDCSDSVRLVNGTSPCSGRLEVKSDQSAQRWSSVCEADFDQQDAEVVCRELDCGAPSVLQGALYGEVEAPTWTKEFQCGGNESALLDCRSSGSTRNSCSPGKAVGLTCSEPVRLAGGDSRCAGTLELKQRDWRPVSGYDWTLKEAAVFCEALDCGSAVSIERRNVSSWVRTWWTYSDCVQSGSTLKDCVLPSASKSVFNLTCSAADKVGQEVV